MKRYLYSIFFLSMIFSLVNVALSEDFIIFQHTTVFKTNLSRLSKLPKDKFILIASKQVLKSIKKQKIRNVFSKIIITENMEFDNLQQIISNLEDQKIIDTKSPKLFFLTNDEYMIHIVAQLREKYNIAGPKVDEIEHFTNKLAMKKHLLNTDIRIPRYVGFNSQKYRASPKKYARYLVKYLGFPIFVKPVSDASSHHTKLLSNKKELEEWLESHKNSKIKFELDEFIDAELYHCDSLVKDNKILFAQVSKYAFPCYYFLSDKILGSVVLDKNDEDFIAIEKFNKDVLSALSPLPNGATHLEIFKKKDGTLVFLEVACRAPGSLVVAMYQKYLGINMEAEHFNLQMGRDMNNYDLTVKEPAFWIWFPAKKGIVKRLHIPQLSSSFNLEWEVKKGDKLFSPENLDDYVVGMLAWNKDYYTLKQDFIKLQTFEPVTYIKPQV